METPKYKFYIGISQPYLVLSSGTIDSSGVEKPSNESDDKYYSKTPFSSKHTDGLYVNANLTGENSYAFFYDADRNLISKILIDKNSIITKPVKAEYYAILFTKEDTEIVLNAQLKANLVYEISHVNPHYKKLSKKYSKENNQTFFRETLDGKVMLIGSDYEKIYLSDIESEFLFIVSKLSNLKNYNLYFKGSFAKTDCKLDVYKKKAELKISAIDSYSKILNSYENTYDLIKLAPAKTSVSLYKRPLIQVYIKGGRTISHFIGGTYWEDDVIDVIDDHNALVNTYYFALISNFNEMQMAAYAPETPSQYKGNGGIYTDTRGRTLKVVKVASVKDKFTGKYAKDKAYNITSGDTVSNYHMVIAGSDRFILDIYVLRLFDRSGDTIGESDYIFALPGDTNLNDIYINGFDSIPMTNTKTQFKFSIENIFLQGIYSRLLCDVDKVENLDTYNLPSNDFVQDNRNYKRCIGLKGGLSIIHMSNIAVDTPTKYGTNDSGKYFTDKIFPSASGFGKLYPVCRSSWVNTSIWFSYTPLYSISEPVYRKKYTVKDAISIADAIKALLHEIDPSIKHEATEEYSSFLYGGSSPIGLHRFYTFITQKSNILKGEYDQAAQKAEITLKAIMDMLRDCFRCYWFIENNKLKIEHIQYFRFGQSYPSYPPSPTDIQFDFTKELDAFNKQRADYFQGEIDYDKTELASRYEFNWMDSCTDLFSGMALSIDSSYIQKDKVEEINASNFTSDIDYMLFEPSNFSNDGFALLCPVLVNGKYELPIIETSIKDETNHVYNISVQNWYASWLYLINTYLFDLPARKISVNYGPTDLRVKGIKTCMSHDVSFISEHDPQMFKAIKTHRGNGIIDEMSIDLDTRVVKAKLLYSPI